MVIPRKPFVREGIRRDYTSAPQITKQYLLGLIHDGTTRKNTLRIASKSLEFCSFLRNQIKKMGSNAWVYREGKSRNLWIIEFSEIFLIETKLSSNKNKIDYIRGYFDADGGVSQENHVRFYIYFAQKNFSDLFQVRQLLEEQSISCGKIHNPSIRIDPNYWRFYVRTRSHDRFISIIGSLHPKKAQYLRMKR